MRTCQSVYAGIAFSLLAVFGSAALAQDIVGCDRRALTDPPRLEFTCGAGLVIEIEASDDAVSVLERELAIPPRLDLSSGAALIAVEPSDKGFQVLTPYAIASVRGTQFVVEALPDMTSVFVIEGTVDVSATDDTIATLVAGDGIDVAEGARLVVNQWPAQRVSDLLARFGR